MFGPKELDLRNTYNPNLQEIQESAERTYGEANSFYRKEELYLKDVERRIMSGELSSEKDIYDECHAIASDLAKCCEMYLKALYIYEHNIPGNQIDELWEKLKNSEFKTDERGNLIYVTPAGEITFVRYDDNGEPIKDSNGKLIYFDKNKVVKNMSMLLITSMIIGCVVVCNFKTRASGEEVNSNVDIEFCKL